MTARQGTWSPLPSGYAIRPATASDLPRLPEIERSAGRLFHDVGLHEVAEDDGFSPEVYEAANAEGRLWVATHVDQPVGYALARRLHGAAGRPDQAHLEQLSVEPEHGRRGIGAALVDRVVRWAEAGGAPDLTLSTFRDVAWNAPYYARLGFEELDRAALSPALEAVREHEAADGLDVDARLFMRRTLTGSPRS